VFFPRDNIGSLTVVLRRLKIIRIVLCCIGYHHCILYSHMLTHMWAVLGPFCFYMFSLCCCGCWVQQIAAKGFPLKWSVNWQVDISLWSLTCWSYNSFVHVHQLWLFSCSPTERHAKSMEIAQEEVLTCLGVHLHDRFFRIQQKLKVEGKAWQLLFAISVDALRRNIEVWFVLYCSHWCL